jgi:hypothetical protein
MSSVATMAMISFKRFFMMNPCPDGRVMRTPPRPTRASLGGARIASNSETLGKRKNKAGVLKVGL